MRLFRIGPAKVLDNYSGLGASYRDGARWNQAGVPVIYFTLSAPVAMLEMANYIPSPHMIPNDYGLGIYEVGEPIPLKAIAIDDLPVDWQRYPHPVSTQALGTKMLKDTDYAGFIVPSASIAVIESACVVINPQALSKGQITLIEIETEIYHSRMFAGI